MAGIYVHIPFCKQACHYCDFHFSTSLKYKDDLLYALRKEINIRKNYINEPIETIYFGGGTPSLLSGLEIGAIIDTIGTNYVIAEGLEFTLEANPDDLTNQKLEEFKSAGVNRFSIGVQSFFEEDLRWMNRAHSAAEAESSIKRAQDKGFEDLTIDLIYGYPLLSDSKWQTNIETALTLEIPHISSYSITVEEKTALATFIKKGITKPLDDAQSASQFEYLINRLSDQGYDHYEISNFAFPGRYSKHNTNYWKGVAYMGVGPSAHSFNGRSRQWNVSHNLQYLDSLSKNIIPASIEELSVSDRVNEYIMTSLRTMWGIDLSVIKKHFIDLSFNEFDEQIKHFTEKGWLNVSDEKVTLTPSGKLFADHIASEMFFDEQKV